MLQAIGYSSAQRQRVPPSGRSASRAARWDQETVVAAAQDQPARREPSRHSPRDRPVVLRFDGHAPGYLPCRVDRMEISVWRRYIDRIINGYYWTRSQPGAHLGNDRHRSRPCVSRAYSIRRHRRHRSCRRWRRLAPGVARQFSYRQRRVPSGPIACNPRARSAQYTTPSAPSVGPSTCQSSSGVSGGPSRTDLQRVVPVGLIAYTEPSRLQAYTEPIRSHRRLCRDECCRMLPQESRPPYLTY